jgi:cellulose biosynthesis protein BcsQ
VTERTYFDNSLPRFADVIAAELGRDVLSAGVVLRDASGRLAFYCRSALAEHDTTRVSERIRECIGAYASSGRTILTPDSLGANALLQDPMALTLNVSGHAVRLVDRRLVGADWLRTPAPEVTEPPRFVFASIKGGVGRTTAICVAAAHLAAQGLRVLVFDFDFEAPGLGAMLLDDRTLPDFGVVDALVENGLSGLDGSFLTDMVGPSSLAPHGGRIDVVPAFGQRSRRNPADVLAKLARAYAEDIGSDGSVATVLDQLRSLVDRMASPQDYDAVLVDARAGLHETTASAILGLGAEVLLFGRNEEQSFQGYSFLLAHLARLLGRGEQSPEWVERITPVQALAPIDAAGRADFRLRWEAMVESTGLLPSRSPTVGIPLPEGFRDVPWKDDADAADDEVLPKEAALLQPLAVLRNAEYEGFDPHSRQDLLSRSVYEGVFRELLDRIEATTTSGAEES